MVKLSDVCELIVDTKHKTPVFEEKGYPCIRTPNIGRGRFILSNVKRISYETYTEWTERAIPQKDDLIYAREAPLGNVAIIPEGLKPAIGQRTVLIRADKKKVRPRYLMYVLLGDEMQGKMQACANGSTVHHINMSDIRALELPTLPDISIQKAIEDTLGNHDDLIENNQRRIRILEDMAQSLYREWFVHFRFPGHEKIKMIDSALGPVPQGWEIKDFVDGAFVHRGRSYRSEDLEKPNGYPFVNLKCIDRDGGFRKNGLKSFGGDYRDSHKVVAGDIVMAVTDMTQERRIVARCGLVPTMSQPFGIISMDLVKIEPKDKNSKLYIYALLRWSGFADSVKQFANGANVLHLSPDHIKNYKCLWPSQGCLDAFTELISPLLTLVDNLNLQNELLSAERDVLLPKLISGEIDVFASANEFKEAA